jgi:uncharacterized protein
MDKRTRGGDHEYPLPTTVLSNGEFPALPQTENQRKVERRFDELAQLYGSKLGMDRRTFLKTSCAMAAAFMAMNDVYGSVFSVSEAEAADLAAAKVRLSQFKEQFIFDVQTHFVRDSYKWKGILPLRKEAQKWNPEIKNEKTDLNKVKFDNYLQEVFVKSDTSLALLTSAPFDQRDKWFLFNDEIAKARTTVNDLAGSKRLYSHAVFTPGKEHWLEDMDHAIAELHPDSWKGYTVGAPFENSKWRWRLDDEKLVYPAYEKMVKAGIRNVCIHKGLLPPGYHLKMANNWHHAKVDDVGKAAKDWPQLNFIIYHSAIKMGTEPPEKELIEFEKTGSIEWVSDLAAIPQKYGVKNVYGELGAVFAVTCVSQPRFAAGILGTLIRGLGADHVLWGTDSIWYGSPQWQIEALRRMEIPIDQQKMWQFAEMGPANGKVKNMIFGGNAARLYGIDVKSFQKKAELEPDRFALMKEEWRRESITAV